MSHVPGPRILGVILAVPLLIFTLCGFTGYFSTQIYNYPGGDSLEAHGSCWTPNHATKNTCRGIGQGIIGGAFFTGIFTSTAAPVTLRCSQTQCRGGTLQATGTGTWGTQKVTFHFCGSDSAPAHIDHVEIDIQSTAGSTLTDISPFTRAGCASGMGTAASIRVGSNLVPSVFVFTCRDCFELTRTNP